MDGQELLLPPFKESIKNQVLKIGRSPIPTPEKDILRVLYNNWLTGKSKITQATLARMFPGIGGHKKQERSQDTTLRAVRQVVRDLRTLRFAPILSDREGYWIPHSESEVRNFIHRMEVEVKARVSASYETYKAMKISLGIESTYLDNQERLL